VLSGRGLCDELITHPEESYRLCCVVVCDLEKSRIGAPYIYDISNLRVKATPHAQSHTLLVYSKIHYTVLYWLLLSVPLVLSLSCPRSFITRDTYN